MMHTLPAFKDLSGIRVAREGGAAALPGVHARGFRPLERMARRLLTPVRESFAEVSSECAARP